MLKLLLVLVVVAAVVYLAVRLTQRRGPGSPAVRGTSRPGPGAARRGPLGPDDDEDFLRDLERKRRRPDAPDSPDS